MGRRKLNGTDANIGTLAVTTPSETFNQGKRTPGKYKGDLRGGNSPRVGATSIALRGRIEVSARQTERLSSKIPNNVAGRNLETGAKKKKKGRNVDLSSKGEGGKKKLQTRSESLNHRRRTTIHRGGN